MKLTSSARRQLLKEERACLRQRARREQAAYRLLVEWARLVLNPKGSRASFELAIRSILPNLDEAIGVPKDVLRKHYTQYCRRKRWTRQIEVTGDIPQSAIKALASMLVALYRHNKALPGGVA